MSGLLKVADKQCKQCLFGKDKIVSEERMHEVLAQCKAKDDHFLCHLGTINGEKVVCRGFYQKHTSQLIRIAERLNMVEIVKIKDYEHTEDTTQSS